MEALDKINTVQATIIKQMSVPLYNSVKLNEHMDRMTETHKKFREEINGVIVKLDKRHVEQQKELQNLASLLDIAARTSIINTELVKTDDESDVTGVTGYQTGLNQPTNPPCCTTERQTAPINSNPVQLMDPSKALRSVVTENGVNDSGVQDFISSVRFVRSRTNDQFMLLRIIMTEKIVEQAKQSIRFCQTNSYGDLYSTLRTQISTLSTDSGSRTRRQIAFQGTTESVQSYTTRFKKALAELEYAVQAKHPNPTARNVALEEEAISLYVLNLRRELTQLIRPMKPKTLATAQQEALNIAICLKESEKRQQYRS